MFSPSKHLALHDLTFDPAGYYRLWLKSSKTDPFGKGFAILLGPSNQAVCRVNALSRYLVVRGSVDGPLFVCDDGTPLSPARVNNWLRSIIQFWGISGNFSSHSFQIGTATSAALAGIPDHVIKALGRWSSDCYLRYIR